MQKHLSVAKQQVEIKEINVVLAFFCVVASSPNLSTNYLKIKLLNSKNLQIVRFGLQRYKKRYVCQK